ncbi:hypothetical protein [Undibacterium flavidum]|uniref:Energy transducer TonB n=1 Tax=Undibacterium flavidum TaxID=2762297 RepID=A0ABR6YAB9_9BURK|nr:hypothetical protein [Undibacterium flavidum]MBC3873524.1 hypothetical protein [Undibacterium flavidum]
MQFLELFIIKPLYKFNSDLDSIFKSHLNKTNSKIHSVQNSMQINRFSRFFTLLIILLAHIAIILIWQNTKSTFDKLSSTKANKVLLLVNIPQIRPAIKVSQIKPNTPTKPTVSETFTLASKKKSLPTSTAITLPEHAAANNPVPEIVPVPTPAPAAPPLEKNIRDLSMSLKDDFLKQEKNFRPESKSLNENMKKFSNAMADAAKIQREGVIIEKKFAYDGRPVSKVKTPYGTYCIRHPKAGEKLELSPPPLPVTCGQL